MDSTGDLELGKIHKLTFRGRNFDFLPILHYSDQQAREAARSIRTSLTGQFFVALLRHFGLIAKLIRTRRCSIDLRRVEFSWLPAVLRLPFVQMLHGEGVPKLQMDSLLRKYSFVHNAGERFAVATSEKFLCVNPFITERLQKTYPRQQGQDRYAVDLGQHRYLQAAALARATRSPFRIVFAGTARRVQGSAADVPDHRAPEASDCTATSNFTTSAPATRTGSPNSQRSKTSPSAMASRTPRAWPRRWRARMPAS